MMNADNLALQQRPVAFDDVRVRRAYDILAPLRGGELSGGIPSEGGAGWEAVIGVQTPALVRRSS